MSGNVSPFISQLFLFGTADISCKASSNPGPNAPMHDGCKNSTQPDANAVAAYNAWTNVGFPPSKIVFGLAAYGYASKSNATSLRTRSNSSPLVTVISDNGQVPFRELVSQGALVRTIAADPSSPGSFNAAGGFERYWDNCSGTPFLRSVSAGQVISYDDPKSLKMKAQLAKELKLRGTNMFDICGDTDRWELTNSVRNGLGLS
jgi:chitinase